METPKHDPIAAQLLIDALTAAIPLVDRIRVTAHQQAADAVTAHAALDRAVTLLRQSQKGEDR